MNSAFVVCLIRVVRRVMLLIQMRSADRAFLAAQHCHSAAWRSAMWRCLHAPLRRWTSFWWGGRSTGAASRRHHVSYDVSAAGLWGCFSQLCVRVGGASRLPVFFPFLSFIHLFIHGGCPVHFPAQAGMGIRSSRNLGGWMFFFFLFNSDLSLSDAFPQRGNEGLWLRWFSAIFLNLNVHKIVIHIINVTICTLVCLGKALSVWFNVDFFSFFGCR